MPHVIPKAETARKVVVVGAGPAGLEAARVCAERGHAVVLFEKDAVAGGQINVAAKATWREALSGIPRWLFAQVQKKGVDIRLNTPATPAAILAEQPDVVIMATGGRATRGHAKGAEHAVTTWDILTGAVEPTGSVLVFDEIGGHNAASTAEVLAKKGCLVELATHDVQIAQEVGTTNKPIHLRELYKHGVVLSPNMELIEIYPEGNRLVAALRNTMTDAEEERVVDRVVVDCGTLPVDELFHALRTASVNDGETDLDALIAGRPQKWTGQQGFALYRVGDAWTGRNIHAALYDSLRLCKDL